MEPRLVSQLRPLGAAFFAAALLGFLKPALAAPPAEPPKTPAAGAKTAPPEGAPPAPSAESPATGQADTSVSKAPVDVVVTGTRTPENARRSPVRVDVVTRAEAERRGATNIGDALAGSLGTQVNPSAYGALGRPSAVQIGGLDRDRVLVLEDGERVVGDTGGAINLAQIPLADVARIETVTGPSSALYGSSAIGGVVNVITAPPELEGPSGSLRAEYRSPEGVLTLGSLAYRNGERWAQLDGSFSRGAGIALDPKLPDLAAPAFLRGFAGLRAGLSIAPGATLTARVRYSREDEAGLETQVVPGLGRYTTDLPQHTDRLNLRLRQTIAIGASHTITLSLGKQWFWGSSGKDRRDSPVDDWRDRAHTMHSGEATAAIFTDKFLSGVLGARLEAESFAQTLRRTEVVAGALQTSTLPEVPQTSLGSGALYGQAKLRLGDSWTVLGGARLEGSSRYGVAVAPSLGVSFSPSDKLVLRVNGGRGYRAPSAKELGFVFDHSVYGYRVIGNPDVGPESSWGVTVDGEYSPLRGIRLRAGFFANWVQDLIDLQLTSDPGGPAGVDPYTYKNIGSARTLGVTLNASLRASPWLRTEVGWSYVSTRDETTSLPLPGRPPHTVLASAIANLPYGIDAVVRIRYVTEAFIEEGIKSPGFGTFDARISKVVWKRIKAYAGGLNLLGSQKVAGRIGDTRPVEGRIFYAGVSADFPWEQ